jgi:prepilin-type N-terminal cleavage/methylation domain-containing protein
MTRVRLTTPAALRDERGFTLVEVLVVVIVIAILSALTLSVYLGYRERAHDAAAQENIHRLAPSIHGYFVEHDSFSGMTIAELTTDYDAAIDPALFSLGSVAPTQSTYCVQSTSSGRTWRQNGPNAVLERQPCP